MRHTPLFTWLLVSALSLTLAACGGGGSPTAEVDNTAAVAASLKAAAALPANDAGNMDNPSAPFTVVQSAGLNPVSLNSPLKVNFAVFSKGKAVEGLKLYTNIRMVLIRLEPASGETPERWVNYVLDSAGRPTTDTTRDSAASLLTYNSAGYYTYTFEKDLETAIRAHLDKTHRVAIQLSYANPDYVAGSVEPSNIRSNPYFDFRFDASLNSVALSDPSQTRKLVDMASCNSCHDKLAFHGGGRVDVQFCVACHNSGLPNRNAADTTEDVAMSTLVHKIHAGRLLAVSAGGEKYKVRDNSDFSEIGFPQDLRNCTKCHDGSNPKTPQGDNWKKVVTKQACLTCHAKYEGSAWELSHKVIASDKGASGVDTGIASDIPNSKCLACHGPTNALGAPNPLSSANVHWNQNEENSARYKFNIESIEVQTVPATDVEGKVRVTYSVTDPSAGNAAYKLEGDSRFNGLRLYIAYQNQVGQPDAVTEFTSYNNGGSGARVNANQGTNDGTNHYSQVITIAANTANAVAKGTARVMTYGAVSEPRLNVKAGSRDWTNPANLFDCRGEADCSTTVSVSVQNTAKDFALSGELKPRRQIVSNDKCSACHSTLGTTSGSNTLAAAFHGGSRNIVEACVLCHDPNRSSSSTIMTNGLMINADAAGEPMLEAYHFKRMIHGIHGSARRSHPFTHGNPVIGKFDASGVLLEAGKTTQDLYSAPGVLAFAAGSTVPAGGKLGDWLTLSRGSYDHIENYAAEVYWPGRDGGSQTNINCNACHVDNSYKHDSGPLGSNVSARATGADPNAYVVISPKAASCSACHDSSADIAHMKSFGGARFGDANQSSYLAGARETCDNCHAPGGVKAVDLVHGLK